MKKRVCFTGMLLLIMPVLSLIAAGGQEQPDWENPAERYLDAYKLYENAPTPLQDDEIKHFIYFAGDRESVRNHPFLDIARFDGAQIRYLWKQLEPQRDEYDFSIITDDYNYLSEHGKQIFIQLADATFSPKRIAVPEYLLSEEFNGGAIYQRDDAGQPEGWVAKRWNPAVQERFALLLEALGREFDGRIEGINLGESSIGVSNEFDSTFTPEIYAAAVKTNMLAMKKAFPASTTMQYANFMPGEWLPWEDRGYLRSIYEYGEEIGVGLGGPDLMVQRKGQLNHTIAMMHEGDFTVPLGIAVQDGNYIGMTGADKEYSENSDTGVDGRKNIVPMLHAFAKDFMKVNYMFWTYQEPYFSEDVIPVF